MKDLGSVQGSDNNQERCVGPKEGRVKQTKLRKAIGKR